MQKVFISCSELDEKCYEAYQLTEDILMENAAKSVADFIRNKFQKGASVLIVSGMGNNGADGVALARQLHGDYSVKLFMPFGVKTEMIKVQLLRAEAMGVSIVDRAHDSDVIVDAIFGAGLNREMDRETEYIIHRLNSFEGYRIACDVPTGVGRDGSLMPLAFHADTTITMGALKEALYLDESKDAVGEIIVGNLGVSREKYESNSNAFVLDESDLRLPMRDKNTTHKGDFGHAAVFCGEKEGAGIIAAMTALRYGAGLATLVVHEKISPPPYLMHETVVPENASAIAIGMGLGGHFEKEFLSKYVIESKLPVVMDADIFSNRDMLKIMEQTDREIVLTPHPKEFVALWKYMTDEALSVEYIQKNRFKAARQFNRLYPHVTLVLKGANTIITHKDKLYINPLGTSRLSKGGSGDVLSGLIVSLLSQGYSGVESAIQGTLALAVASNQYGGANYAMVATDIVEEISKLHR